MDCLRVRSLPFLTRRNFVNEFRHILPWSVLAGLVEGQFGSVVVAYAFHGSPLMIAIALATPMAAMLSSLLWGMLCVGRPKVRLAILFASGATVCAGLVAAIPTTDFGAIWFLAQMACAQVFLAGVVTVRSAMWKSNYPRSDRGRITARLQGARVGVSVLTVLAAGWACDRHPESYRFVYPLAALCGAASLYLLSRVRVRGERRELRGHRGPSADGDLREGMIEPFSLTALLSPGHVFGKMFRVLRDDARFAYYCLAQALLGVSNLMTMGIVVAAIAGYMRRDDGWDFWIITALIIGIPRLLMLGTMRRWAHVLDRHGVVRLRVSNVTCLLASLVLGLLATAVAEHGAAIGPIFLPLGVALFALRGFLHGASLGGGALAWNLGHLHFAKPEDAEIYMGIHVFLTGVRGLIAPLAGIWLWQQMGWQVWLIAIALCLMSLAMYMSMARREAVTGEPNGVRDAAAPNAGAR